MKTPISFGFMDYISSTKRNIVSILRSLKTTVRYIFNKNPNSPYKEITEQYPDPVSSKTPDDLPARTRGVLKNKIEQCIGCHECALVCPTQTIFIESEKQEDTQKEWVSIFNIDHAKCVFCGLCVEGCPTGSLIHEKTYELSEKNKIDLVLRFGRGEQQKFGAGSWT